LVKNDGSGNFKAKFILDLPTNNPHKLKLINLNNDDLPDVAIEFFTGYCQLDMITYTNLGNRNFSNPQALKDDCSSMEFKDINNDGFIDYIFQESGNLYWYKNTQGQFASEPNFLLDPKPYLLPESGPSIWRYNLAATDINLDNHIDLISHAYDSPVNILLGDGTGQFTLASRVDLPTNSAKSQLITIVTMCRIY